MGDHEKETDWTLSPDLFGHRSTLTSFHSGIGKSAIMANLLLSPCVYYVEHNITRVIRKHRRVDVPEQKTKPSRTGLTKIVHYFAESKIR